ncbi:MAG: pilus assembly protein PilZ, partial [Devosia sp.]|nr:pilus assembly protein PilZ [Devosia sp.]
MLVHLEDLIPQLISAFERNEVRCSMSLPGRYAIADTCGDQVGSAPEFACRLSSISSQGAVIKGPVLGFEGERASLYFNEFGKLPARVARCLPEGFAVTFELSQAERATLAAKILWHKRHLDGEIDDARAYARMVPKTTSSVLILPTAEQENCIVTDISRSGAAVMACCKPRIRTPLALGRLLGQVVRHTETGFALRFLAI